MSSFKYRILATAVYENIIAHKLHPNHVICFGDGKAKGDKFPGEETVSGNTYPAVLNILLN